MSTITRPNAGPVAGPLAGIATIRGRLAGRSSERERADAWAFPALAGVAGLAAVLYLVNLTVSGYANTYYAMAAQAASQSWSAWFFGALDASGFITVDKPPLATMVMGLSVRLFGLSSWSILLPQALMGVASVAILFLAARRSFGTAAATIAGVVMALTPAAVLIFRYDNPDALLTLLLVSAAWALLRALEAGRVRWLALAGTLVGLGFMTKFLQGWLVLPVFALVWIVAAPGGWRRRIAGLAVSAAAVAVASLAWPVAVELIPATARPYVGGSTGNSVFDLILGYDGLGRILGGSGNGTGGGGGGGFGGSPGLLRMFNDEFGGQVAWLIPYALVALATGLLLRLRAGRTDRRLVGYLLWGGWLVVQVLVFSFMSGTIHSYYTVVLAPAIGALVGAGTVELWRVRARNPLGGVILAGALAGSGAWAWALLERTPSFAPGLGIAIVAVTVAAALLVAAPPTLLSAAGGAWPRWRGGGHGSPPGRARGVRGPDDGDGALGGTPAAGPSSSGGQGGGFGAARTAARAGVPGAGSPMGRHGRCGARRRRPAGPATRPARPTQRSSPTSGSTPARRRGSWPSPGRPRRPRSSWRPACR